MATAITKLVAEATSGVTEAEAVSERPTVAGTVAELATSMLLVQYPLRLTPKMRTLCVRKHHHFATVLKPKSRLLSRSPRPHRQSDAMVNYNMSNLATKL